MTFKVIIMVTTTSNVGVFDQSMYQALNAQALKYFREDPQLNWLPQAIVTPIDAPTYKKPIYGASIGVKGANKLGLPQVTMTTPQSTKVYNLEYVEGNIYYDVNDMLMEGQYLVQRKGQEQATWEDQVKQAIFKGVFTDGFTAAGLGQGKRLNDGIIEQATLVEDLDGANSQLVAAGDVYKALDKMLGSIPFRYRDGRKVFVGCDDLFARNARRALYRGSTNQISELDLWFMEHSQEVYTLQGQAAAAKPVVSDELFLNTVVGTTKTEADTLGTHSRLFMAVIDPNIIEQAYSRVGMVGEDKYNTIQSVVQKWAARVAGCVHDANAVVYSERITWA